MSLCLGKQMLTCTRMVHVNSDWIILNNYIYNSLRPLKSLTLHLFLATNWHYWFTGRESSTHFPHWATTWEVKAAAPGCASGWVFPQALCCQPSIVQAGNSPRSFENLAVTWWRQAKRDTVDNTLGIEEKYSSVGAGKHKYMQKNPLGVFLVPASLISLKESSRQGHRLYFKFLWRWIAMCTARPISDLHISNMSQTKSVRYRHCHLQPIRYKPTVNLNWNYL